MKKTLLFLSIFIAGNVATISHATPSFKDRASNAAATAWKYKEPALVCAVSTVSMAMAAYSTYEMIATGSLDGYCADRVGGMPVDQYLCNSAICRAVFNGFAAPMLMGCGILMANDIRNSNQ